MPHRGEIWFADLTSRRGYEHTGSCPILVISNDTFNRGPAGLVLALPLTRMHCNIPLHIAVDPPEGGLSSRSYILCDSITSIMKDRLAATPCGKLAPHTLHQVDDILRVLMNL
jgi:mRNA interferase MazF